MRNRFVALLVAVGVFMITGCESDAGTNCESADAVACQTCLDKVENFGCLEGRLPLTYVWFIREEGRS